MDIHVAYISVGSNLGDKLGHCRRGVEALAADGRVRILAQSRVYRTEPVDYTDQDWFINGVIKIGTDLGPLALLAGPDRTRRPLRAEGARLGHPAV